MPSSYEKQPILLTDCTVICAAGDTTDILQGLHCSPEEKICLDEGILKDRDGYFGMVDLPARYQNKQQSRTCRILHYLAAQIMGSIERVKSTYRPNRVAVIVGTTTTGIREVEMAESVVHSNYHQHQELSFVAEDLANTCGLEGPNLVVSTACTSGAKALGLARNLIETGWCDAAIVGAGESLCRLTCQGFDALESYAKDYCRPFQFNRDGINIGEGGALFVMEKGSTGIALAGFAESSDAIHESAPDPNGVSAEVAIRSAMADAGVGRRAIDYINLHGTGTPLNDAMEAKVIRRIFGESVPASSTKQVTGHMLGAAGAVEAAVLWSLLNEDNSVPLPPHHGAENYDSKLPRINLVQTKHALCCRVDTALSTSFAFGGHNAALVLAKVGN